MSDQDELPGLTVAQPRAGYLQAAVTAAVEAADLDDRDQGMGALAAALARAVDRSHMRNDPYAVATTGRELRETLVRLRMDPQSRHGQDAGQVEAWLKGLQATE